ncbi:MAG: VaFE repeat-containing surface-anchored protein [Candidatus Saccharimonadaceae bacterium]|nr:VaFE repeat-containing surface-anchored protein [Candidatus Saccharimonadaceae bacterium]
MIKLSKIKIFKRAMLSVLSLAFLLGGAFFAAKMVKTFHVNAAEIEEDEVGALTGEEVNIRWSKTINYDNWLTRNFEISYKGSSTWQRAYCAQPYEDTPTGEMSQVEEIAPPGNNGRVELNAIKLLIYLADTADAGQTTPVNSADIMNNTLHFNDLGGGYGSESEKELRYAYVHAVIGYLYGQVYPPEDSEDDIMVGLTSGHRSLITDTIAPALQSLVTSSSDAWLIAQNSALYTISTQTQQMVWIKLAPQSANIEVKKCDSTGKKCSGAEFDGITFKLYNNSGRRIYAAGINGGTFFNANDLMLEATITGGTGKVTFSNLPLGVEYKIVESGTNNYYILTPPTSKTITLDRNGGTGHLTFNNKGVSLDTTATDAEDGDKFVQAGTTSYIKDVVEYCVVPNKEYTIKGKLMDKSTGKELLIGGEPVTSEVTFTPTTSCGTAEMTFEFDGSELGGKDLVVFESLYLDNELITSHEEIDDPDQTIRVVSLGTTATDASDGDKTIIADGEATINDRIKYCLVAGKEYTIIGTLMNKSTGEPIKSNNEVVSKSITITPEEDCGEVDMEFKFDTTGLGGTDVVVFEKALILNSTTDDYDTIASHEDLDDEGQTIKIVDKAPETGMFTGSASSTTGGINILVLAAAGVSVIGVGGYLVTRATAKKRFMSRR